MEMHGYPNCTYYPPQIFVAVLLEGARLKVLMRARDLKGVRQIILNELTQVTKPRTDN